ncbi:hypothetical protein ACHAWU_004296 [Discostella pseudostelligera]|uniref:Uncharacterized protein n=1 Tax=Discostella pseudostelligera TaxID=259834 RepID=A0ABD3M8M7_9STRA
MPHNRTESICAASASRNIFPTLNEKLFATTRGRVGDSATANAPADLGTRPTPSSGFEVDRDMEYSAGCAFE